jgi:predicted RNA-binding Zn-ribbon protein involved in translation (DUF1610 family)
MKRREVTEELELDDGTTVHVTFARGSGALVRVRAGKLGNGPDDGVTQSLSIDAPGEWFERVSAAVWKLAQANVASRFEVCPDHGRWRVDYNRPDGLRYACPTCKPTHGQAAPANPANPTNADPANPTNADDTPDF